MASESKIECLKDELGLELNKFNKPATYTEYQALARLVINLLFLKPGTYPNLPEMGINIEQYKFMFMSQQELDSLELDINTQINTYIPNTEALTITTELIDDDETGRKVLGISFALSSDSDAFYIYLNQDSNTNDVQVQLQFSM